ncbi:hypothetical protein BT96DRAFT_950242 [Gymnopus androsaceus JB14]|uniref:Uncharacterized protein n=1 Tax=Gymnopus androsaceus JB14 TaxID=1447944 RepID=A0A6A4GGZ8_9AGAR|nr:hypothetical protein BT96DRAFT_950242 [Gymnopus androsaceus JB14]
MYSITFVFLGFFLLFTLGSSELLDDDAVSLYLLVFAYFFLGVSTVLGIYGALRRSRRLVSMFSSMTSPSSFSASLQDLLSNSTINNPGDIINAYRPQMQLLERNNPKLL